MPPAEKTSQPFRVTVLKSDGKLLNKRVILRPDGSREMIAYQRAKLFVRQVSCPIEDVRGLARFMGELERDPHRCVVRGRPCGPIHLDHYARRLKHPDGEHPPTLEDAPSRFLPIDIDGLEVPGADPLGDPEGCVDAALDLLGLGEVSCYWGFTASQQPDSEVLNLRLYLVTDEPHTGEDLKRWAMALRARGIPADPSIYSGAQIIYTARPTFAGGHDPLPRRSGFLERAEDVVRLEIPDEAPQGQSVGGEHASGLGLEARLALIGDHPGGAGIHGAIRDAIAAAVARHGSGIDRESLKALIRQRVAEADTSRHSARYVEQQTSDRLLDASIEGAVRKFGAAAGERRARREQPLPAYQTLAEAPVTLTPAEAQARLREITEDLLRRPTADGRPRCAAVRAPAGLGKSMVTAAATRDRPVLWFAPTHRQAEETATRFGDRARVLRGRLAADPEGDGQQLMCWRGEEAQALADAGLGRFTARLLCYDRRAPGEVARCPHWNRCGYRRQMQDPPPVLVVPHDYLGLPEAEVIGKARERHPPALAVIDESPLKALVRPPRRFPADALIAEGGLLGRIVVELVQGRPLREIAAALDKAAAVRELEAALEALPSLELPPIYPGAPATRNLRLLKGYRPDPRARLRGAYRALIEALRDGKTNGVWCVPGDGDQRPATIHVARVTPPAALGDLPVLLLDASADPEVTAALLARQVEFNDWHVPARGVRVTQVRDRTCYRRKLADPASGLQARVAALVTATGAALVTHRGVLEQMREGGLLPEGTSVANFNGLRGLDALKDCQALVVAGRIEPPPRAVEAIARALWPAHPLTLDQGDYSKARTHYRMRDGTTVPAAVRAHPDPLVNRVLTQTRDAELVQAVGRMRAIHGAEGRRLFVLTSVPVPGLEVDVLTTLNELLPDARASRGLIAGNGVLPLAPRALVELLPGEWATTNAARLWVRDTLRKGGGTRESNTFPGIHPLFEVRYRLAGQRGSPTAALTWHRDEGAVRAALETLHGRPVTALEFAAPAEPCPAHAAAPAPAPAPSPPPVSEVPPPPPPDRCVPPGWLLGQVADEGWAESPRAPPGMGGAPPHLMARLATEAHRRLVRQLLAELLAA